jgi:hypothetical protein
MEAIRDTQRLVPKVHPATRPVEQDDPLEMFATGVPGDPEVMLQCLIQEYAWMGWNTGQIFQLFADPNYPALHSLLCFYGEAVIRERIANLLGQTGVFRCEGTVIEEPEPSEELVELGIPAQWKGNDHAHGL